MNYIKYSLLLLVFLCSSVVGAERRQPRPKVTRGEDGYAHLEWLSLPGRTYFVQYSYDLVTWNYTDEIFQSGLDVVGMTFDPGDDSMYLRLKYTDFATSDAETANFDGAGGTNREELDAGTDPMLAEPGEVLVPTAGAVAPPPEVAGIEIEDEEFDEDSIPAYFLKFVETKGDNNGTRYYFLNENYTLLPGIDYPGLSVGESSFPANISRSPDGVVTKITFELVPGVSPSPGNPPRPEIANHEKSIDLMLYEANQRPVVDSTGEFVRKIIDLGVLTIPRMETKSKTITLTGKDDPNAIFWKVSPFVTRGLENSKGASNAPLVYSRRAGTDVVSRSARPSDIGYSANTWIMAPAGSDETPVEIEANPAFPIVLASDVATIAPNIISNDAGTNGEPSGSIRANFKANAADGTTGFVKIRPEDDGIDDPGIPNILTTTPVSILARKRRTVIVNIRPISSITTGSDASGAPIDIETPPSPIPSQQVIQEYLDRVFLDQNNVKCQVVLHPTVGRRWDIAKGKVVTDDPDDIIPNTHFNFFALGDTVSTVGDQIFDKHAQEFEEKAILDGFTLESDQVHVFLIGGCEVMRNFTTVGAQPPNQGMRIKVRDSLGGYADFNEKRCFVKGNFSKTVAGGDLPSPSFVMDTLLEVISHEVGHVLISTGHPDGHDPSLDDGSGNVLIQNGGPAPLANDQSLQRHRLMASGGFSFGDYELVQGEWKRMALRVDQILDDNE